MQVSRVFTAERGRTPVEEHPFGGAGGCVSGQGRAEALLAVHTRTNVITTKLLERSRIDQEVARAEHV